MDIVLYAISYIAAPLMVAVLVGTERIRWSSPHCGKCDYDLAGLGDLDPCPECGAGPERRTTASQRYRWAPRRFRIAAIGAALPLIVAVAIVPLLLLGYSVIGPWTAAVAWEQTEQDLGSDAYANLVATTILGGCGIALLARWLSWRYVLAVTAGALAGVFTTLLLLILRAGGREPMSMLTSWSIGAVVAPGMTLAASGAALWMYKLQCRASNRAP